MPRTPRARDPEATRQKIDDAALLLFAEQGFSGTSTSEIAKSAGVAEGTIFRHYPTKKALLLGVMRPFVARVVAPLATQTIKAVLQQDHDSVESMLMSLARDRITFAKKLPPAVRVAMQEASLHEEVRDMVLELFVEHVRPGFRHQIDALKAKGRIDVDIPTDRAIRMVVSVIGGYVLFAHVLFVPRIDVDDNDEIATMVRVLARGLAPISPAPSHSTATPENVATVDERSAAEADLFSHWSDDAAD